MKSKAESRKIENKHKLKPDIYSQLSLQFVHDLRSFGKAVLGEHSLMSLTTHPFAPSSHRHTARLTAAEVEVLRIGPAQTLLCLPAFQDPLVPAPAQLAHGFRQAGVFHREHEVDAKYATWCADYNLEPNS